MNQIDLLKRLLATLDDLPDHPIEEITTGAHIVTVKSRKSGLATWAVGRHPVDPEAIPFPGIGSSCKALAQWVLDGDARKASLGMAAFNSLLPDIPLDRMVERNAADLMMELGRDKRVALIGHFPFVAKMRGAFSEFMVFEKDPGEGDIDAAMIPEKMPDADVVALTATTLCNGSLAGILSHCRDDAVKLIIGPTTPLSSATFDLGFDYVAGSIVEDLTLLKEGIQKGVSFKEVKGVRHVILKK